MSGEYDSGIVGVIAGMLLTLATTFGGFMYDGCTEIQKYRDPSPIEKRYNELQKDKEVVLYRELKNKPFSYLEEVSDMSETFKSILDDPELLEYKKVCQEINKRDTESTDFPWAERGAWIGLAGLSLLTIRGAYLDRKRRKQKLENNND